MKALLKNVSMALLCLLIACFTCFAQTIQFDANGKFEYHFNENIQSSALPPGIVFSGKINYSKAEDGDCYTALLHQICHRYMPKIISI